MPTTQAKKKRSRNDPTDPAFIDAVVSLKRQGLTHEGIAKRLNTCGDTIRKVLTRRGYEGKKWRVG